MVPLNYFVLKWVRKLWKNVLGGWSCSPSASVGNPRAAGARRSRSALHELGLLGLRGRVPVPCSANDTGSLSSVINPRGGSSPPVPPPAREDLPAGPRSTEKPDAPSLGETSVMVHSLLLGWEHGIKTQGSPTSQEVKRFCAPCQEKAGYVEIR